MCNFENGYCLFEQFLLFTDENKLKHHKAEIDAKSLTLNRNSSFSCKNPDFERIKEEWNKDVIIPLKLPSETSSADSCLPLVLNTFVTILGLLYLF